MRRFSGWVRRAPRALLGGCFAIALLLPTSGGAAPIFGMVDASTVIVRGTIDRVTPYDAAKLTVYRVQVGRVLKGEVAEGEALSLAQEMLFATTQPYFTVGLETLILAVPLPNYSAFRKVLPEGRYWRWTERLDVAGDVAMFTDPLVTEAVTRYLAVRADAEASADFLVATLTGPHPRLRNDALVAIRQRPELPPLLDAERLQVLEAWLEDQHQPVVERAQMLVILARMKAPGIAAIAERRAAASGPLQAPAVDALVSLDRVPSVEHLLTWSTSSDEALRIAASRGLAKVGSPAALDRLGAMLRDDASPNVRLAIVQALGGVPGGRSVELLSTELAGTDKGRVTAAAESLGRLGSPEAIAALGVTLEKGSGDAQAAAAFALKRSNKHEAEEILHQQEASHPDPNVRKLCRLALGESMHEH